MAKLKRLRLSDELLDYLTRFADEPDTTLAEVQAQVTEMDEDEADLEYGLDKREVETELERLMDELGEETPVADLLYG